MISQREKIEMYSKTYRQILFCGVFSVDHFDKNNFLFSSRNDGTRVKIPENEK